MPTNQHALSPTLAAERGSRKFFAAWLVLNSALLFAAVFWANVLLGVVGVASSLVAVGFGLVGVFADTMSTQSSK